jgi:hypothetical protein
MKYLLNLPLAVAALLQVWFAGLVFMSAPWSGWSDGPSRGAMVLVMLEPAVFCWLLLLLAMVGAAFTDAFDWLPVGRRWLRRLLVVGAALVTVALAVPCVATAIGSSAAVADRDTAEFGPLLVTGAMVVAVAVPFALAGWLARLIDAPSPWRDALWPRGIGLGALALLLLIGCPLGSQMLAEEIRTELATSRRYQQEIDERETARTADFAQLTDASPLHSWGAYATDELDLKEGGRWRCAGWRLVRPSRPIWREIWSPPTPGIQMLLFFSSSASSSRQAPPWRRRSAPPCPESPARCARRVSVKLGLAIPPPSTPTFGAASPSV